LDKTSTCICICQALTMVSLDHALYYVARKFIGHR
jgi:hypothetical protein